jgi:hypothetical protein
MSELRKGKGVKLKPRAVEETEEEVAPVNHAVPPSDIYESVVATMGFDPLKEMAARRT